MGADMAINNVLDLAASQANWLLARQNLVAENVANANTPGYKTTDLKPFTADLQSASLQLTTTSAKHMSLAASGFEPETDETPVTKSGTFLSGNTVSLEWEMMKGGEISRAYSLNVSVVKTFNAMLQQATKG